MHLADVHGVLLCFLVMVMFVLEKPAAGMFLIRTVDIGMFVGGAFVVGILLVWAAVSIPLKYLLNLLVFSMLSIFLLVFTSI